MGDSPDTTATALLPDGARGPAGPALVTCSQCPHKVGIHTGLAPTQGQCPHRISTHMVGPTHSQHPHGVSSHTGSAPTRSWHPHTVSAMSSVFHRDTSHSEGTSLGYRWCCLSPSGTPVLWCAVCSVWCPMCHAQCPVYGLWCPMYGL